MPRTTPPKCFLSVAPRRLKGSSRHANSCSGPPPKPGDAYTLHPGSEPQIRRGAETPVSTENDEEPLLVDCRGHSDGTLVVKWSVTNPSRLSAVGRPKLWWVGCARGDHFELGGFLSGSRRIEELAHG